MNIWIILFLETVSILFKFSNQIYVPNENRFKSCNIEGEVYELVSSKGKHEAEQWLQLNDSFALLELHEHCECYADSFNDHSFAIACNNVAVYEVAPTIPFSLSYLGIENFTETTLNRNVLYRLGTTLTILKLENGKLSYITPRFLEGLIHLKILSLKQNNLRTLQVDLFQYNPFVETFDVSENKLESIQQIFNATWFWKHLKNLDIFGNPLEISDYAFTNENSSIEVLNISSCGLETIGMNAFSSLISLKQLIINYNFLNSEALFNLTESLKNISLEHFEMDFLIRLTRIPTKALANLANITRLHMRFGQYPYLHEYAFPRLMNLTELDLSSCKIQSIHPNAFKRLPNLEELNLENNHLSSCSGLTNLPSLQILDLQNNNFRRLNFELKEKHLSTLVNLMYISFAGSKLHLKLPNGVFDGLFLLDFLSLSNTGVAYIEEYVFQDLTNLMELHLSENSLLKLESNSFYGLRSLQVLSITYNKISLNFDKPNPLRHLETIEYLSLYGSKISVLHRNMFAELNSLREVNLGNNLIESWNYPVFPRGKQLKIIGLGNNKITSVSSQMLGEFSTLEKLSLEGNPLMCMDCEVQKYLRWVTENPEILLNPLYEECFMNDSTKINIFNVTITEEQCHIDSVDIRKYLIVIVVVLVFIALAAFTCYRGRWYLMYIVIQLRNKVSKHEEHKQDDFEFDAFISYSNEDSDWIARDFLPNVERRSIKLCLHQRDFQVGIPITDNVIMAIEKSRKTVLIISKNYVQSVWCLLEAQLAQITLKDAKRNGIVVVLLQDVPRKLVPDYLRRLLETRTYIAAPENKEENKIFWDKIVKAVELNFKKQ